MNKLFGAVHIVIALLVALHFMFGDLLGDAADGIWDVLGLFMLVASILGFYFTYSWIRGMSGSDEGGGGKRVLFMMAVFLVMWLIPGFLGQEAMLEEAWWFIAPLFVVMSVGVGKHLLKTG